jgi:O-antigen/teichoic acid export membrane protein
MVGTIVALNAALVLLVYGLRGVLAQRYVQQPEAMALLLILILLVPVQALDSFMISLLTVFSGARSVFFRKYLLGPILLLSVVLVTLIGGLSVKFLAAGYLLGGLIGIIIYTTVLVRLIADRGLLSRRSLRALRFPAREVFGFTTPLLISDVIFVLRGAFVVVLLEHFGTLSDVASFRAVFPVARLNLLVFQSFAFLFTPATARLFARDDLSHINSLYWRTAVWIAVLSFPVFALSFCAAQPLTVLLFGQGYAQSALLLSIMAFGFYVSAAMGFSGLTLRVYGKVRALFLVDFVGAALSLCASLLLIPRYGALGGAISTGGTLALQTVLYQVALRTETGIHAFEREYLKAYLTLASGAAGLLLFQWLVSPGMLLSLLAAAGASAVVLRLNRRLLGVADTFPELLRMPLARRFFAG